MSVVSEHKDRVVYDRGDRFVKEFRWSKDRDAELENLRLLVSQGDLPEHGRRWLHENPGLWRELEF